MQGDHHNRRRRDVTNRDRSADQAGSRATAPAWRARLPCETTWRWRVSSDILSVENFECVVSDTAMLSPLIREIVLDLPQAQAPRFSSLAPSSRSPRQPISGLIPISRSHQITETEWDRLGTRSSWWRIVTKTGEPGLLDRQYACRSRPHCLVCSSCRAAAKAPQRSCRGLSLHTCSV